MPINLSKSYDSNDRARFRMEFGDDERSMLLQALDRAADGYEEDGKDARAREARRVGKALDQIDND